MSNKYRDLSPAARAGIWFTVCNYLLRGISLITIPLLTRVLSTDEYGVLSEITAMEEIILMLSNWDISVGAYLKGLFKYADDEDCFTTTSQLFANCTTIITYLVLLLVSCFLNNRFEFSGFLFTCMFLNHLSYSGYRLWLSRQQRRYTYRKATISVFFYGLLVSVLPIIAVLLYDKTAQMKFGTAMVVSFLFCIPFWRSNYKVNIFGDDKEKAKRQIAFIVRYQAPFLVSSLSLVLLTQFDRIIISQLVGHAQTAFYGVACNVAAVMSILYNSIGQALTPWKYDKLSSMDYKEIRKIDATILAIVGCLAVLFVCVLPEVFAILLPDSYSEAISCIPILVIGGYYNFFSSFFVSVETFCEKTKYTAFGMIACSGINILLNFILIKPFGYSVCAYTTAISYLVYVLINNYFSVRVMKDQRIEGKLYDYKMLYSICIVVTFAVIFMMLLYPFIILRYMILIFAIVSFVMNIRQIKILVEKIKRK